MVVTVPNTSSRPKHVFLMATLCIIGQLANNNVNKNTMLILSVLRWIKKSIKLVPVEFVGPGDYSQSSAWSLRAVD